MNWVFRVVGNLVAAAAAGGAVAIGCRQGPLDAGGFRLVKDGRVWWEVAQKDGGVSMSFFVKGRVEPSIVMVTNDKSAGFTLQFAANGPAIHHFALDDGVSCSMVGDAKNLWTGLLRDRGDGFKFSAVVNIDGEKSEERVYSHDGGTFAVQSPTGGVRLNAGSEPGVLLTTPRDERTLRARRTEKDVLLELLRLGRVVSSERMMVEKK